MFDIPVEQVVYDLVDKKQMVSPPVTQQGEQTAPAGAGAAPPVTQPPAAPPIRIDLNGKVSQ